jgi:hypothetical protein
MMSSNQLLAKVGVFVLVALNLGAYYFFWPGRNQPAPTDLEHRAPRTLFAGELPRGRADAQPSGAEETSVAAVPAPARGVNTTAGKLAKTAKNDELALAGGLAKSDTRDPAAPPVPTPADSIPLPKIPEVGSLPKPPEAIPPVPEPPAPPRGQDQTLEMLKKASQVAKSALEGNKAPIVVEGANPESIPPVLPVNEPKKAVAPPKSANSPWSLQMEIVGGRTVLTAHLHKTQEFRITCQRVEMKTPDGSVLAVGQVTFAGPGISGACDKLTLPLSDDRMLLEGKAEVQIEQRSTTDARGEFYRGMPTPTAELKGEQLTLRLTAPPASPPASAVPLQPTSSGPSIIPGGVPGATSPLLPTAPLRPAP